VRWRSRAPL